jgi:hypothetical protein
MHQHNNTPTQQQNNTTTQQHNNTSNGAIQQTFTNHNVMNPHADPRELQHAKNAENQRIRCADSGRIEEENDQRCARRKTSGVVECKSAQQATAREVPGVVERESVQQAQQERYRGW